MSNASTAAEPWPDFIGSLSHELRHEVSAVLHQVELLRSDALDELTYRRSLAAIESNAENLMGFIEDLSELGRIVRGEVTPRCRWIDIDVLMGAAVQDRARPLDWAPPGDNVAWTTYTDPLIVDQIVTGVLDHYHRDRHGPTDSVRVSAQRSTDRYIDVVFTSNHADPVGPAPFRTATLDDGLSMFVAGKSAELMGGEFGILGPPWNGSYLLRLPQTSPGASQSTLTS